MFYSERLGGRMLTSGRLVAIGGELLQRDRSRHTKPDLPQLLPTFAGIRRPRPDFEERIVDVENGGPQFHSSKSNGKRFSARNLSRKKSCCARGPASAETEPVAGRDVISTKRRA